MVCLGDFNEVSHSLEKHDRLPKQLPPMLVFKEMLLHCELMDLEFHGYSFTWQNGRPGAAFVELHLDRACANMAWQALFPTTKVLHQQITYSDHDLILINT